MMSFPIKTFNQPTITVDTDANETEVRNIALAKDRHFGGCISKHVLTERGNHISDKRTPVRRAPREMGAEDCKSVVEKKMAPERQQNAQTIIFPYTTRIASLSPIQLPKYADAAPKMGKRSGTWT